MVPRAWRLLGTAGLAALGWWALLPAVPARQPAAFDHSRHARLACAVCHQGVETGTAAGLPEAELCRRCHAKAPDHAPKDAFEAGGRLRWAQLTRLPSHVMFSHRRHVALGRLECASCHGAIARLSEPPSRLLVRLDMKACLSCHRREGVTEDCAACHR